MANYHFTGLSNRRKSEYQGCRTRPGLLSSNSCCLSIFVYYYPRCQFVCLNCHGKSLCLSNGIYHYGKVNKNGGKMPPSCFNVVGFGYGSSTAIPSSSSLEITSLIAFWTSLGYGWSISVGVHSSPSTSSANASSSISCLVE